MKRAILLIFISLSISVFAKETIQFQSLDDVLITADIYKLSDTAETIILFHQSGFSRGEYIDIAPKLNELGFNCVAIDQRSGRKVNGIKNETYLDARKKDKKTFKWINGEQDIVASINFFYKYFYSKPLILWGSSYSSSLVLKNAVNNSKVKAVLAFSPGEYFKNISIKDSIIDLDKPFFITSSKREVKKVIKLIKDMNPNIMSHHIPLKKGKHGSKALWAKNEDNEEYWGAVKAFLHNVKD